MNAYEQTRQALVAVQKKIEYLCGSFNVPNSLVAGRMEINGIINAALAIPRRNCDVLSADDVKIRFKEKMAGSDMGLIGEYIVEAVSAVVDFLYATEKGGAGRSPEENRHG